MALMRSVRTCLLSLLLCLHTTLLHAFEMTLDKPTVETALMMFFPVTQEFGAAKLTLTNPSVNFSGKQQRVYLNSSFDMIENSKLARGKLKLSSQLAYEAVSRQIQLKEPVVESIEFLQNDSTIGKSLEQTLKQNQGKIVPVIILLDLNKLGFSQNMMAPKQLRVSDLGIVVEF